MPRLYSLRQIGIFISLAFGIFIFFNNNVTRKLDSMKQFERLSIQMQQQLLIAKSVAEASEFHHLSNNSDAVYITNKQDSSFVNNLILKTPDELFTLKIFPFFGLSENYYADSFGSQVLSYEGDVLIDKSYLSFPTGILEHNGITYIADAGNGKVFEYTPNGVNTIAENLLYPTDLLWFNNALIIVDTLNSSIYQIKNNQKELLIGSAEKNSLFPYNINEPIAIDAIDTTLFITQHNGSIIKLDTNTGIFKTVQNNIYQCPIDKPFSSECFRGYDIDIYNNKLILSSLKENKVYAQITKNLSEDKIKVKPPIEDKILQRFEYKIPIHEDTKNEIQLNQQIINIETNTIEIENILPEDLIINSLNIFGRNIFIESFQGKNIQTLPTFLPSYYAGNPVKINLVQNDGFIHLNIPEIPTGGRYKIMNTFVYTDETISTIETFTIGDQFIGNSDDLIQSISPDIQQPNTIMKNNQGLLYSFWSESDSSYAIKNLDDPNFKIILTPPNEFTAKTHQHKQGIHYNANNISNVSFSAKNKKILEYKITSQEETQNFIHTILQ